jgi:nitrous oxide reductase accessory protein NosL
MVNPQPTVRRYFMAMVEAKTYEDYLQEARNISKDQLRDMSADWRVPNMDESVDMKKLAEPNDDDIKFFGGM